MAVGISVSQVDITFPVAGKSPANAGDAGSIPRSGRCPGGENGNPLQYSCLENSTDRGAWKAIYSLWGCKELVMTEQLTLSLSSVRGGN